MKRAIKRTECWSGIFRLRVGWRNDSAMRAQPIPGVLVVLVGRVIDVFSAAALLISV